MVRFIYGDPGTGKTEAVYSAIEQDALAGNSAILIVPEQMTVSAERAVIKRIPPSSQLNIEVLNFSRLANRLFRAYGGLAYSYASAGLQKLLMWRALRTALPFLSEYKMISSDDSSLSDAMLATYKELSAGGITLASLDSYSLSNSGSVLSKKIKDISTVCSVYSAMLSEHYTDASHELERLSSLLESRNCLGGINVYIDGFTSFTGLEHRIIDLIIKQAERVTVTIGIPEPSYSGIDTLSLKQCSDKLRRACASASVKVEQVLLTENHRATERELAFLSSELWAIDSAEDSDREHVPDPIELYRAADLYDECEFAAARIRELIASGYRYKDIAVIARDIDKYKGIIEPALDNMELRYFISEKTDLSLSPIARLILSALKILSHGWKRADVIAHLKTGLCGIQPHDADIFESYTAKWNISGGGFISEEPWSMNPDGYTTIRSERGEATLHIANEVKALYIGRLKLFISELKGAQSCAEMCGAVLNYLEALEVRATLIDLAARYLAEGKTREASDCTKLYDVAIEALDCVCDAFADGAKPDIASFATAIRIAFSESELGSIPTSQDEIIVGSANMLRTSNIKCAVILGACDGEFPAGAQASGLFTESERDELISKGIELYGDSGIRASDELFYFRRAAATPSERLIIFTRADSEPSFAFTRITNIYPTLKVIDTSSQLLPRLATMRALSEYEHILDGTAAGEAIKAFTRHRGGDTAASGESTADIKLSAADDTADPMILKSLLGNDLRISQSKVELYNNCRFAYACRYYLSLQDSDRAEFAYNSMGTFIHYVLEKFLFWVFITNKGSYPDAEASELLIDKIIESYINELLTDKSKKSARLIHLCERLKLTSRLLIADILKEFADSSFKPEFFELRVGSRDVPSISFELKDGSRISLSGVIDRVDVYRADGKAFIRVVDYKTGNKTFSVADISEGINLQLLLYIFSLTRQNGKRLEALFGGKPTAGAITYLSATAAKLKAAGLANAEAACENANTDIKRTGLILDDEDVIRAISHSGNDRILMRSSRKNSFIDSTFLDSLYAAVSEVLKDIGNTMISGNINAKPKLDGEHCNYCKYSYVCKASRKT